MSGQTAGGNDTATDSSGEGFVTFYGDAGGNMSGHAHGGNDSLQTGLEDSVVFYGDAGGNLGDHAVGGDDAMNVASAGLVVAYGDAMSMSGHAHGGNDTLAVRAQLFANDLLVGDAQTMSGNTHGGNDVLSVDAVRHPQGTITLIGDAQTMSGNACGGNDTLISGNGNDDMWGDAQVMLGHARGGNDTFVFNFNNGQDKIEDFGQGVCGAGPNLGTDHIDVSALGIKNFSQLDISAFDPTTHQSTIAFSPGNDVVVHSQIALTAHDFLFA
jgi:hypothetical protein